MPNVVAAVAQGCIADGIAPKVASGILSLVSPITPYTPVGLTLALAAGTASLVQFSVALLLLGIPISLFARLGIRVLRYPTEGRGKPLAPIQDGVPAAPSPPPELELPGTAICTRPRTWNNALACKEFRYATGGTTGLLQIGLCYFFASLLIGLATIDHSPPDLSTALRQLNATGLTGGLMLLAQISYSLAQLIADERRQNTLDSIVLLPLTTWELLREKLKGAALGWTVGGPLAVFCLGLAACLNASETWQAARDHYGLILLALLTICIQFPLHWGLVIALSTKLGTPKTLPFAVAIQGSLWIGGFQAVNGLAGELLDRSGTTNTNTMLVTTLILNGLGLMGIYYLIRWIPRLILHAAAHPAEEES
ncbi:hypothetical protein [Planctomicrobium sp. SH664]|uniref:hypothetical protein n=1 Tax=Planctomicrobium sp. SH664 TaxID=3448125 RepID=UPI003F5BE2C5